MITVYLNDSELRRARDVGERRFRTVDRKSLRPAFPGATVEDQIVGAEGELAFCKAVHLPWPASVDTFTKEPDVWPNWEVRTSRRLRQCKVARKDPPDRLVVAVLKVIDRFEIHGYIRAGGAQKHYPAHDKGGRGKAAHFVPLDRLVPINDDFHSACGYAPDDWGLWACAYCAKEIERGT